MPPQSTAGGASVRRRRRQGLPLGLWSSGARDPPPRPPAPCAHPPPRPRPPPRAARPPARPPAPAAARALRVAAAAAAAPRGGRGLAAPRPPPPLHTPSPGSPPRGSAPRPGRGHVLRGCGPAVRTGECRPPSVRRAGRPQPPLFRRPRVCAPSPGVPTPSARPPGGEANPRVWVRVKMRVGVGARAPAPAGLLPPPPRPRSAPPPSADPHSQALGREDLPVTRPSTRFHPLSERRQLPPP
ncbi:basic proline-rich protein-like [Marmota monax]|uniref:basic proline-rich protein-like n=1 Tax=Marmota monax TaxID=9995 RepID=UPI001EB08AD1|nr:basic proline-rich protein-like [Marmota monax]